MKLAAMLIAAALVSCAAIEAHATTNVTLATAAAEAGDFRARAAVAAEPAALTVPDAPVSGIVSWLLMSVILTLTGGAKRSRKVRTPDQF